MFPVTYARPLFVFVLALSFGCSKTATDTRTSAEGATASAAPLVASATLPPDRLAPGELRASSQLAFGFPIPDGMTVDRAFPTAIHLVGEVSVQGLIRYVQERTTTGNPELRGNSFHFSSVKLSGTDDKRTFAVEISSQLRTTRLTLTDITPTAIGGPPAQSDEERWRRAGLKPSGEPLDVTQLQ